MYMCVACLCVGLPGCMPAPNARHTAIALTVCLEGLHGLRGLQHVTAQTETKLRKSSSAAEAEELKYTFTSRRPASWSGHVLHQTENGVQLLLSMGFT